MAESPYTRLFGERSVAAATFFYDVDGSSGVNWASIPEADRFRRSFDECENVTEESFCFTEVSASRREEIRWPTPERRILAVTSGFDLLGSSFSCS